MELTDKRYVPGVQSVHELPIEVGDEKDQHHDETAGMRGPWFHSLIKAAAFVPRSVRSPNSWAGHLPFASWLIQELSPHIFVELGTHTGNSYFAFCQAVLDAGLPSRCYAVDTWRGDEHAGQYGDEVFAAVSAHHQRHYAGFSKLMRMPFDDALAYFSVETVDLLHIDGLHTYDAVRHDFETWLPKLSPGAVILFHDTQVRERGFGVWRLWEELQASCPNHMEFAHSHGLGVLQLNNAPAGKTLEWLRPGSPNKQQLVDYFAALGERHFERYELDELRQCVAQGNADLNRAVAKRDRQIAKMRSSLSWRITFPLREMRRWGRAPGQQMKRYVKGALRIAKGVYRRAVGVKPLLYYVESGAAEMRNPNPHFDARAYVAKHPEAAPNPVAHYVRQRMLELSHWHRPMDIAQYLPRVGTPPPAPTDVTVDIIVPVYRGLEETRRCLESVLSDTDRPPGSIRVIDDCSPEPELSAWLASLAATGRIELSRNKTNLGFVATVNRGMADAGRHDVVLLNSDTEVPSGFVRRLASHAYAGPRVASVTPFTNYAGWSVDLYHHTESGGSLPMGYTFAAIDDACRSANASRNVDIPTAVGFCMYIRRDCIDEIGLFDVEAFGRGYGEETDFCMRASAAGWHHRLACDTFVYHVGGVSFGKNAHEKKSSSWNIILERYPHLPALFARHVARAPMTPAIFAATVALFSASPRPTVLIISHKFAGNTARYIDDEVSKTIGSANVLLLAPKGADVKLFVPSLPGHPTLRFSRHELDKLHALLHACAVSRVHVQHRVGFGADMHALIDRLGVPVDLTMHDHFSA